MLTVILSSYNKIVSYFIEILKRCFEYYLIRVGQITDYCIAVCYIRDFPSSRRITLMWQPLRLHTVNADVKKAYATKPITK